MAEEKDIVLRKSYKCPACDRDIKDLKVKHGKTYLQSMDLDLKPNFKGVEPIKYSIIQCSFCGYTAMEQYWDYLAPKHAKEIQTKITPKFVDEYEKKETYSFTDAFKRFKYAMLIAEMKSAKDSEKGLLNLKMGWLYRSAAGELDEKMSGYADFVKKYHELEDGYLIKALDYLLSARANEHYPICGMDELTFDTLLSALCAKYGRENDAKRMIGDILTNKLAPRRVKDKAREIKEFIDENKANEEDEEDDE